ncbi:MULTISPECIES: OmpA family protein [Bacteroidales]|jgi:ompA family protein|uniref:OmpA family protein n=1 Tax=Bacteroidales TaxID=171549 RepID=UPI000574B18A|nr:MULTISPECIES: OmpA family protein [Bacteroidales]KHM48852.1 membrane protein [Coprobacter secundus]
MRKSIILSAFVITAFAVNAQTDQKALQGTKLKDNWSIELKTGMVTPLTHSSFFKDARFTFGLGVTKQLTPIFGMEFQGMGYVNTTQSKTAIDVSDVSLLNKFNLMNLFGGYTGTPRLFEMEAVAGIGWMHYYMNGPGDDNSWSTRFGLNFNFNFGESKAWTLGIKPAIVYDMEGDFNAAKSRFNANNAAFELTAGVAYHFKGSNGKHHFTKVRVYDQAEINQLNANINNLRSQVDNRNSQINSAAQRIQVLQSELDNCRNQAAKVQTVVEVETSRVPESIITFRQGRSTVDASQLPNVERVANYMKKHADVTVVIKGYASPEGNLEFNKKLAQARAEAVKSILVKKYKINTSRITAEGQGIGDMFTDPDWNRVSICTIEELEVAK